MTAEPESATSLYEDMFKDRYTERDAEYMKVVDKPLPSPPIVHPWSAPFQRRDRRPFDRGEHRGGYSYSRRDYRDRRDGNYRDRRDGYERDNRRDRRDW